MWLAYLTLHLGKDAMALTYFSPYCSHSCDNNQALAQLLLIFYLNSEKSVYLKYSLKLFSGILYCLV